MPSIARNVVLDILMFLAFLAGTWVLLSGGKIYFLREAPDIVRIGSGLILCYGIMAGLGIWRTRRKNN